MTNTDPVTSRPKLLPLWAVTENRYRREGKMTDFDVSIHDRESKDARRNKRRKAPRIAEQSQDSPWLH